MAVQLQPPSPGDEARSWEGQVDTGVILLRGRDRRFAGTAASVSFCRRVPRTPGQSGRTPEHQTGCQFIFMRRRCSLAFDLVQQGLKGNFGQLVLRHLNCRKGRNCKLSQADLVETDYRDVRSE